MSNNATEIYVENLLKFACKSRKANVEGLLNFLKKSGFYTSPCSGSYHLCSEGGLVMHSLNVYRIMYELWEGNEFMAHSFISEESVIIVSLLHDLGKVGDFGQPNYVINMIKDGRPTKAEPKQKYKQSESNPYKTNSDIPYVDHEIRSVEYIRRYIKLTPEEYQAILWHNGLYGTFKYQIQSKETPLYLLLHFADMWASRVIENKTHEEEN